MGKSRNTFGTAFALTVFTAILPGQTEDVRTVIERLPRGQAGPFARLEQLHFSRLQIIGELVYQGGSQKPDTLKNDYLVFTASFDGRLDPFLDAICEKLPAEADTWWSHCVGYPGAADREAFKRYIKHNQLHTSLFGVAYPTASVQDVRESLALRERVLEFAVASQGLDAAELQQRFARSFAEAG